MTKPNFIVADQRHARRPHGPTLAERFWARVDQSAGPTACWPWHGSRNKKGYGFFGASGLTYMASRVAWALAHDGEMPPDGRLVCHSCDNPPCCNPAHFFLGDDASNKLDCLLKDRQWKRLSNEQVLLIVARLADGASVRTVAGEFGIGKSQVSRIGRGERRALAGWLTVTNQ